MAKFTPRPVGWWNKATRRRWWPRHWPSSRSSLYYRKKPRGSRADRSYDEQIVTACGEKPDSVHNRPSRLCRHPSIRTLVERFSLGASWVYSFQQVLLPVL